MESCQAKNVLWTTCGRLCSVAAMISYVHCGTTMSDQCGRHPTMAYGGNQENGMMTDDLTGEGIACELVFDIIAIKSDQ